MRRPILKLGRFLCMRFYQDRVFGGALDPRRPIVLTSNHRNGLVDAGWMVRLDPRMPRFLVKHSLFRMPILGWVMRGVEAVPVVRKKDEVPTEVNQTSFEAVHTALIGGDLIGIFPEGTSWSGDGIQPLKTGAARMALGAAAATGFELDVVLQPVGYDYEDRDRYCTSVEVEVGEPIVVSDYREEYEANPRHAGRVLTQRLDEALRGLVFCGNDADERARMEVLQAMEPLSAETRVGRLRAQRERFLGLSEELRDEIRPLLDHFRVDLVRLKSSSGLGSRLLQEPRGSSVLSWLWMLPCALCVLIWGAPILLAWIIAHYPKLPADKYVTAWLLAGFLLVPMWALFVLFFPPTLGLGFGFSGFAARAGLLIGGALLWRPAWRGFVRARERQRLHKDRILLELSTKVRALLHPVR